jgi:hypothetical protein
MTLILSGTDGLSDVDGTAATPAIRGTDANTGIFFPAADTIAFSEGGAEAMRIDSSGNVGIGTASPSKLLQVTNADRTVSSTQVLLEGSYNAYGTGISFQSRTSAGGSLVEMARIVADGEDNWNTTASTQDAGLRFYTTLNGTSAEKMRIDSSGNLLVGTTGTVNPGGVGGTSSFKTATANRWAGAFENSSASSPWGVGVTFTGVAPNNTSNAFFYCTDVGGDRFYMRSNGGLANFSANNVNLSDRREKTNFAPAGDYLTKICAIPVQTFNYIDQNMEEDDGLTLGVVAQDVQTVAPELVMESDWSSKKDGSKMRLSIYQTDLQYALMKSIQELKALVDGQAVLIATQASTITALQADVASLKGTP